MQSTVETSSPLTIKPFSAGSHEAAVASPRISFARQWWALTGRGVGRVFRGGEVIFAFISPASLAICFYLPLRSIMDATPGLDYGQFLMPIIMLQSVNFVASSAAMRAAFDGADGINMRFRVMPMAPVVPMLARTATNAVLLGISLTCAAIAALLIGWRPHGGVWGTVALFGLAALVGALFSWVADGIGLVAGSPEATSQSLALPTLILGMMSTGFVPIEQFPEWIQPFVRNQPISQFADSMRALDSGTATWGLLTPSLLWCVGLAITALLLLAVSVRRNR